jgi:hypothetical protein
VDYLCVLLCVCMRLVCFVCILLRASRLGRLDYGRIIKNGGGLEARSAEEHFTRLQAAMANYVLLSGYRAIGGST